MNQSRRGRALAAAVFSVAAACGVGGCVQDTIPFDPRDAQKWEVRNDSELRSRPLANLPTTETTNFDTDHPDSEQNSHKTMNVDEGLPIPMSLKEIVHRTVANNLDIRVAAYDTAIDQTRIIEAESAFDPTFFTDYSFQRVDKPTAGTEIGVPDTARKDTNVPGLGFPSTSLIISRIDLENIQTFDIGFRQNTSTGAQFQIKQEITNNWFSPARTLLNPYYENSLVISMTQPLLQNFGTAVNEARIDIARNNQRISLLDFRKTLEDTVLKVEQDYWQLVEAQQDVVSIEKLLRESQDTTDILQKRFKLDATAPQLYQARAETSARRSQLVLAKSRVFDISDDLKRLMHDPRYPVSGAGVITGTDAPSELPVRFDLDDQIETGMKNRYELGQQQIRIESSGIAEMVAKNGLLPSLDLQLQYQMDAVGHSFTGTFENEGDFNHNGGTIGFQFNFPIGNRGPRAVWFRAQLQRMQAIVSYAALVTQVSADVKQAARHVDTAWLQLSADRESRLYFQGLIDKLQTQIDLGADNSYTFEQVFIRLQDQQQLQQAEQLEHQHLNDYNFAIATLEKAKGTILRYNNVMMEQDARPLDQINRYGGTNGLPFELTNTDR